MSNKFMVVRTPEQKEIKGRNLATMARSQDNDITILLRPKD